MPQQADLSIYRGQPYTFEFVFPDTLDFTGETWRAQVRDKPSGELLVTFAVTVNANTVTGSLTLAEVDALPHQPGGAMRRVGVWDLERDGVDTPFVGVVRVTDDVTRA